MLILSLILLLMASGRKVWTFLMLEFSTLVHHPINHLNLCIATMRGKRDVSVSSVYVSVSMTILLCSFLFHQEERVMLPAMYTEDWLIYYLRKMDLSYGEVMVLIRYKLSFVLVRSTIMCIRSTCSWMHFPVYDAPVDVQIAEVHIYVASSATKSLTNYLDCEISQWIKTAIIHAWTIYNVYS